MWEIINQKEEGEGNYREEERVERLSVPGGWIVRTIYVYNSRTTSCAIAQTFVSDTEHAWKLK